MTGKRKIAFLLFLLLGWSVGLAVPLGADETEVVPQPDTTPAPPAPGMSTVTPYSDFVLNEIVLTPDYILAIDTGGREWHYDLELDMFVEGPPSREDGPNIERPVGTDELPVEVRCTEELKIKEIEKSVRVKSDEYVAGDIVALDRVLIRGWVQGDVRSINGVVIIKESGQIDGDVEAPEVLNEGVVLGHVDETGAPLEFRNLTARFSTDGLVIVLVFTVVFLVCSFLVVSLMPTQLGCLNACIIQHRVKTYALGFLLILLMPVLITLVTITLIGIIVIPFIPFIYLAAIVLGIVAFGVRLGNWVSARYIGATRNMLVQSFLGVFLLMLLWIIVAILLGQPSEVAQGFGIFFLVVSIIVTSFPVCSGVGAAALTRFGFRDYVSWKERKQVLEGDLPGPAPAPAPPPLSKSSPESPPDIPSDPDR